MSIQNQNVGEERKEHRSVNCKTTLDEVADYNYILLCVKK